MVKKEKRGLRRSLLLIVGVTVVLSGFVSAFAVSVARQGQAHASAGMQLQQKWQTGLFDQNSGAYLSPLAISSGIVYATVGSNIYGMNETSGAIVWHQQITSTYQFLHVTPIVDQGKLYVVSSDSTIHVFDATNDQLPELWSAPGGMGLTIDNGILFTQSSSRFNGNIYAYNSITGQLLWQKPYSCEVDSVGAPVISNGIEYLQGCESTYPNYDMLLALNAQDGSLVWSKTGTLARYQSLPSTFVGNGLVYSPGGGFNNNLVAYSATDGSTVWSKMFSTNSVISEIAAVGSFVYINLFTYDPTTSSYVGDVYALDGITGNELWHQTAPEIVNPSQGTTAFMSVAGGLISEILTRGVYIYDATSGNELVADSTTLNSIPASVLDAALLADNTIFLPEETQGGAVIAAYTMVNQQPSPTPSPPVTQWQSPANGFYIQGTSVTLSVGVTSGADQITGVTFTASWDSNTNVSICNGGLSSGSWVCMWGMTYNSSLVRNGQITFGYTVVTARGNIVNPNGTVSGTIVYEKPYNNPIYAGYAATSQNNVVTYNNVVAKWIVPTANCGVGEVSESAIWDGIAGKTQLAQIGTESNCRVGFPTYDAVWEVIPFTSSKQVIKKPVSPGDVITATVNYNAGKGTFQLTLADYGKWTFTKTNKALTAPSERTVGECIVEAPSFNTNGISGIWPLTDFGSVTIDCKVNGLPVANGPQDIKFIMVANNQKADTKPLQTNGEIFTIGWLSRI